MKLDWWTLGFQAINVLVLVWLLARFFWRPVAGIIAQRRAAAQQMLDDAQATQTHAIAALAEIARTREGIAQERAALIETARDEAARLRTQKLAQLHEELEATKTAAMHEMEHMRRAAEQHWTDTASSLAVDMASRLVARLNTACVHDSFLDWLLEEIRKLSPDVRAAATAPGVILHAVSAAELSSAQQEHTRDRITEALGAPPTLDFRVDPALIAGLELHGPGIIISNSWQADLSHMHMGIRHDDRS